MAIHPLLRTGLAQRGAVSGIKPRGQEQLLRTSLRMQTPAKRAELKRLEDIALHQAEQEQFAGQHEAEMTLREEAQKETARLGRESLALQAAGQETAKEQAQWGTWLQSAALALQAWQGRRRDPWDYTTRYTDYGYDGGDGYGGGDRDVETFPIYEW